MEQIFVTNLPLLWLQFLLLHHCDVLDNMGSVFFFFTHLLEAFHINPHECMKYLLTDMSYELEEQQLSPSYLLLGVHQYYDKLALQKKDLLQEAQPPIYILFFLVVYFFGFVFGVFFSGKFSVYLRLASYHWLKCLKLSNIPETFSDFWSCLSPPAQ